MSLVDEAKKASGNRLRGCRFGRWLADGADGMADEVAEALADDSVSAPGLAKALTARGHTFAPKMVQEHRNGKCRCEPS